MIRNTLFTALILAAGFVSAQLYAGEPVFDDQAFHTQLLPQGSLEYEYALKRKGMAQTPKPSADAEQISEAMQQCDQIAPLSAATREKCEIRARQGATVGNRPPAPVGKHVTPGG